jgi:hypothetical protein
MSMTLISTVTVGGGSASTIDFTSIPQTFTDLILVISARSNNASSIDGITLLLNGSSASFTYRGLNGTGTSVASATGTNRAGWIPAATLTSNTFGNASVYFPNYTSSTNKPYSSDNVIENDGTLGRLEIDAGIWANTAAITSLTIGSSNGSSYAPNSTAYLYGVAKGSGGATVS